jgi:VIT1/CCC1 family predicted Fe2+/Mn2+ transporter
VNDEDYFDYLRGDTSLPGEVPVTGYAESARRPPPAQRRGGGQPDYAHAGLNGTHARPMPNGRYRPEYPPSGRPVREYPARGAGSLLAEPPSRGGPAAGDPSPRGRRILGWLPFGQRLVLLPKGALLDDPEEELREHRDVNGGWLRPAVFGAMDGLVTNSSLIAGIGGGGGNRGAIVLSGIAGLIAGAFSMATGEYISVTSQNELTQAEVELERKQHARDPAGKQKRLTEVYMDKGVSPNLAEAVVRQISADPDRAVATHVREELGIDPDDLPSPRTAAAASFAAFTVGALIPARPVPARIPRAQPGAGDRGGSRHRGRSRRGQADRPVDADGRPAPVHRGVPGDRHGLRDRPPDRRPRRLARAPGRPGPRPAPAHVARHGKIQPHNGFDVYNKTKYLYRWQTPDCGVGGNFLGRP